MVFVTHDMREASILGDRIGLMKDGKLVALVAGEDSQAGSPGSASVCGELRVSFFGFMWDHRIEVAQLTLEHLLLVGLSMLIAAGIGFPLGVLMTRKPALSQPILTFANVVQTIPSLALFGFLIPLPFIGGIGARSAIVALVLYSLLPIIRNTFIGISGVDPAIKEAGRGMGMTDRQLLWKVEIPLALGVIFAGVRVATVLCVGIATIAAAIGAGGLGMFIFRGVSMVDSRVIFSRAIPAAALALAADFGLGAIEKKFSKLLCLIMLVASVPHVPERIASSSVRRISPNR